MDAKLSDCFAMDRLNLADRIRQGKAVSTVRIPVFWLNETVPHEGAGLQRTSYRGHKIAASSCRWSVGS